MKFAGLDIYGWSNSGSIAVAIYCDNTYALHIAAKTVFHGRKKHLEMDCYLFCDNSGWYFLLTSNSRSLHYSSLQALNA
ncbi:hypothetical protein CR513_25742, partial [Mucuna pruriens]